MSQYARNNPEEYAANQWGRVVNFQGYRYEITGDHEIIRSKIEAREDDLNECAQGALDEA
jgi:hypothetical protein